MCEEEKLNPLSQSTCYKILIECPASFSKCLKGLDNMLTDGLDAFESIENRLMKMSNGKLQN